MMVSSGFDEELSVDDRFRIKCLCLQKLSPSAVIRDIESLNVRQWLLFQEWFVQICFKEDYYARRDKGMSYFIGDTLYWKNLLHKCVKASQGNMSESMADALIELDGSLQRNNVVESSSWLNKTYLYGVTCGNNSTLQELHISSNSNMFQGSTGCFEWDAGYSLAEYIMNYPEAFRGRVCIELGCGCGMVGAILSQLKGRKHPVICTDGDWETLGNCAHNLRQNNISVVDMDTTEDDGVTLLQYQWEKGWASFERQIQNILFTEQGSAKILVAPVSLLGADLLYDPDIIPVMVPLISEFLESMHSRLGPGEAVCSVYLATRKRSEDTLRKFLDAVDVTPGLHIECVYNERLHTAGRGKRFYHIPSLDESRAQDSIILHRLTLSAYENKPVSFATQK